MNNKIDKKEYNFKIPNWLILSIIVASYFVNIAFGIILTILYIFFFFIFPQIIILRSFTFFEKRMINYNKTKKINLRKMIDSHLSKDRYLPIFGFKIHLGKFIFIGRKRLHKLKEDL